MGSDPRILKANTGCDVKLYRNKVSILGEEKKKEVAMRNIGKGIV
jgi:rRNA processing protein Krr1/Pno1